MCSTRMNLWLCLSYTRQPAIRGKGLKYDFSGCALECCSNGNVRGRSGTLSCLADERDQHNLNRGSDKQLKHWRPLLATSWQNDNHGVKCDCQVTMINQARQDLARRAITGHSSAPPSAPAVGFEWLQHRLHRARSRFLSIRETALYELRKQETAIVPGD